LSFMVPGLAIGGQMRLIHVELSYSGSAVSYNLYKDGVQACVNNVPGATQMDCNVAIDATPMTFVLTAVDAAGVESPQSAPYVLVPPPLDPVTGNFIPQANFTTTVTSGMAPLPVSFDASGSSDLDGLVIAYAWDFGDGGTGAGKLIDYTFAASGTYTVTLTVVDDRGASAEETTTITVGSQPPPANTPPVAVITATPLQTGTSRIGFDAYKSSDPDGTIASYAWNFGDGDTAVGNYIEHEFMAAGNYTVVLTVTDDKGASKQDQIVMTVVDLPKADNLLPVAVISASSQKRLMHFAWDYTGADPGLAGFRLYQNSRLVCEVANPLARETDCLTYVDNGLVQLWVASYNQVGAESAASASLSFDSTGMFPVAGGGAPLVVHFTSGASTDPDGTIVLYAWNFGDGATAEGKAADHVFTLPGVYTVTMTVTDNSDGQAQATMKITVAGINPPIASNASFSTGQEKSVTGTLSANDPDGGPLTFKVAKNGSLGTATITNAATGVFTYVPKVGSFGADTFTFKANDGTFDSNEAVVSINITKKNSAPTATNQPLTTQEDIPASGALAAADADNDPMTFAIVTPPAHGVAVLSDSHIGAFQYTPAANYNGQDSFTFKANDGQLDSAVATVSITIAPVNDAPTANPDSAQVESGKQVAIAVLGNDTDIENNPLTIASVTTPAHGQAVITNGGVSYTANANFTGTDSFSYAMNDGAGGTATGTVTITVVPPVVVTPKESFAYTWDFDATVSGLAGFKLYMNGGLICETSNPAARTLTCQAPKTSDIKVFSLKAIGANSTETNVSNTITYDPKATVTPPVQTNVAPVATNQTLTLLEDVPANGTLLATDTNNDPLTFSLVTPPAHGVATVAASGAFTYSPTANFNGMDNFTFRANDGKVDSSVATVSLTVTPVNDPPTAAAVNLSATEDVIASGQLSGSDPDNDSLTYSIVTNGSKGVATITNASTGTYTYTPANNENGQDTFVYRVSDGKLTADVTVTVTITPVNDAPIATDGILTTLEDTVGSGQLTASDPDGDSLSYAIVTNGSKGVVTITNASAGTFTYAPANNENGQDTFTYRVSDGKLTADAKVVVTIPPVNDAPLATNDTLITSENTLVSGQLLGSDPDGDRLTYSIITNGSKGTVSLLDSAIGLFTYSPSAYKNGQDTFVYRVSDGTLTADATVTVNITPVNYAPVAVNVSLSAIEDTAVSGQLFGSDPDGDRLSYSVITNGSKGTTTITDAATGAFTYTPAANQYGQDSFVYRVSDGALTADATTTVIITHVNHAPLAANVSLSTYEDTAVSGQLSGSDTDSDRLSYSIITNGSKGAATITDAATGAFTYTPAADQYGQDSFVYRVSDGTLTADATVSVTITHVNHAPRAVPMTLWATEDVVASGQLPGSDVDGDRLNYSIVTNGSKGNVVITDNATGAFTYTPVKNANGQDTFVYRVSDGALSADATVTVTIDPVNDAPKAIADLAKVSRGKSVSIPVLANDTDVDGDPLTLVSVTVPKYGKVAIVNGAIVYTANATFVGKVTFNYTITDGNGGTANGAVTVTVTR